MSARDASSLPAAEASVADSSEHTDTLEAQTPRRRPRRALRTSLIATAVLVVAATGAVAATGTLGGDSEDKAASTAPTGPPKTTKVQRATLTRTETVDGNLGYGSATALQAAAATAGTQQQNGNQTTSGTTADSGQGVLTWLPAEGDKISRGEPAYRLNEQKVPLLYGSTPLYRILSVGADGKDVKMLEQNLAKLGYKGFTVDDEYTSGTAEAVKDWQEDLGREQTGTVAPGDAVVAAGARRVADVKGTLGSAPAGDILTWTGTERIVTVDLDVQYEDLVDDGTAAALQLPDGTQVTATVAEVGTAATAAPSSQEGGGSSGSSGNSAAEATLPVTLTTSDQKKLGRYNAAPVDVTLTAETHKNVLTVPINALVALQEGGYGLETVGSHGIEYVPVKLGMFAGGRVEVSGPGVRDGLIVGVPK
ncbi:peptidoglycan-binding protein [Streptomyces sp. NPDC003781]|uniref:peptidoglycan-binding protein n=1 Tax=Streptomyces sp. NPDC003781 TaxID=3364686 RepID=UPI00368AB1F2